MGKRMLLFTRSHLTIHRPNHHEKRFLHVVKSYQSFKSRKTKKQFSSLPPIRQSNPFLPPFIPLSNPTKHCNFEAHLPAALPGLVIKAGETWRLKVALLFFFGAKVREANELINATTTTLETLHPPGRSFF